MAERYSIEARAAREGLTAETLRDLLSYDPETGIFRWLKPQSTRVRVGQVAGWTSDRTGYSHLQVDHAQAPQHRLAWLYVHGHWPFDQIDHINGNRSDNRIVNLRECNDRQNRGNSKRRKDNTTGFKGVRAYRHGKWIAQIAYEGRCHYLGIFANKELAHEAYLSAARRLFGEFANDGERK